MAQNVKELLDFVLPLVQSGKEDEAKKLLAPVGIQQAASHHSGVQNKTVLPALLKLIRPEHASSVANYLTEWTDKEHSKDTMSAAIPAKRDAVHQSAAFVRPGGASPYGSKKNIAPKKTAGAARMPSVPVKQRPAARRPAKP